MFLEINVFFVYITLFVSTLISNMVCVGAHRRNKKILPYSRHDIHGSLPGRPRGTFLTTSRLRPLNSATNHAPMQLEPLLKEEPHQTVQCAEESQAHAPRITLLEHQTLGAYTPSSGICLPTITADQFEINPGTIQTLPIFYGEDIEHPYKHLDEFEEICSTVKLAQFSDEALRLKNFPFSLKDRAKQWLSTLPVGTITTWEHMKAEFLKRYFLISRTNTIRKVITSFGSLRESNFTSPRST